MMETGFIEVYLGLWYKELDGTPWSNKRQIGTGKGCYTVYDAPLNQLKSKTTKGYRLVFINKLILWHLVVYQFFKGQIPECMEVDHIDGNHENNLISNLQLLSHKDNCSKRRKMSTNTSGYVGVCKYGERWRSTIQIDGKYKSLGHFDDPQDAYKTYYEAKIKYHGPGSVISLPLPD